MGLCAGLEIESFPWYEYNVGGLSGCREITCRLLLMYFF